MDNLKYIYNVFISSSAKDGAFVSRLAADLEQLGLSVWRAEHSIHPGESFADAIGTGLDQSRFILAVMSPDYFDSIWAQQEFQRGLAAEIEGGGVRVIPLFYRNCEVPPLLRQKRWVDFRDAANYELTLHRLALDIRTLASRDTTTAPPKEIPKPGERVEELDQASLADLKTALKDAVKAFQAAPTSARFTSIASDRGHVDENVCFVVMPFSVESLNIVYEDFIRPTLEQRCQLRVERGDDVFGSNVIMDDIAKSINRAALIIADLTDRNPNVFYEVGIAHALNKQVLLMTQSIEDVPFDLRHRRALVYQYSPRGCKKLETDLYENVQNMRQRRYQA